jgi:hypothetical protein
MTQYKPTKAQQQAVEWFTARGKVGYAESIDALHEAFDDVEGIPSGEAVVFDTLGSISQMVRHVYEAAEKEHESALAN